MMTTISGTAEARKALGVARDRLRELTGEIAPPVR